MRFAATVVSVIFRHRKQLVGLVAAILDRLPKHLSAWEHRRAPRPTQTHGPPSLPAYMDQTNAMRINHGLGIGQNDLTPCH